MAKEKKRKKPNPGAKKAAQAGDQGPGENDVRLSVVEKDGEKLIQMLQKGHMAAILSKNEIMYVFIYRNMYCCFIHPMGAPEGRKKFLEMDEKNRAIIKQLAGLCDQMFQVEFREDMDRMGVMVAAERAIIDLLDMLGKLPAQDFDFMAPLETDEEGNAIVPGGFGAEEFLS